MNIHPGPNAQHQRALRRRGQSAVEFALLTAGVTVSTVALAVYLQNAIGARVKSGADALSPTLANPEQVDVAFIRCQDFVETQTARSGAGDVMTRFTEVSRQLASHPAPVGRLTDCPQAAPLPPPPSVRRGS